MPTHDDNPSEGLWHKATSLDIFAFAPLLFPLLVPAAQTGRTISLRDNSDWWSTLNEHFASANVKAQHREPADSNFRILDVALGEDQFREIATVLGKATVVERGDASTGRSQVCYASADDSVKVHLVFEKGELDYSFYLFTDGPKWNGSDLCVKSKLLSTLRGTASGLRLGQTRSEVEAILGKPGAVYRDKVVYFFQIRKRTSAEELKKVRQQFSNLSDKDFHENYDFYNLSVHIEARFAASKLSYLVVSKSEAY